MSGASGALAARPPRRLPALLPFLRIALRPIWYFSSADADPPSLPASTTASGPRPRSQQRDHVDRLSSVIHTVNDRKLPPELRGRPNAIRSETDIVNVVEQRIWHSMEEGHFDNLPGRGKPLDLNTNPHADPAEDTLYRILSRNGCAPEWIELNKEIRCEIVEWRIILKKAWANGLNHKGSKWLEDSESLKAQMRNINTKVLRYNLMVPFGRQMFGLKWEKEIDKLNNLE